PEQSYIQVSTDNILFICGGTFSGIEHFIARRLGQKVIGFGGTANEFDTETTALKNRDLLIPHLDQKDLIDFGLIPEFVGRLPVIAPMLSLTKEEIIQVMTQPKNALVKQYQAYFDMDGCKLEFTDEALADIAAIVLERETGVRALRALFEELLLELRYDLPNRKDSNRFVITREIVTARLTPTGKRKGLKDRQKTA
ncbi:MAG: AAA family ATPase, partial [Planctomycetes bacterium]|nr:AAA family ATPase [Planctomycetota bacterium]